MYPKQIRKTLSERSQPDKPYADSHDNPLFLSRRPAAASQNFVENFVANSIQTNARAGMIHFVSAPHLCALCASA
jgi:hypothetical protein